jgi:hypothetical protein
MYRRLSRNGTPLGTATRVKVEAFDLDLLLTIEMHSGL